MYKKIILGFASALLCTSAQAKAIGCTLYEDWSQCNEGELPAGWTTTGTAKTPDGIAATSFEYGEGMKVMTFPESNEKLAVSYSTTLEGGKVDMRLVSPVFQAPACGGILSFTCVNYNPGKNTANKIEVLVADASRGNEESILIARVPANNVNSPATYMLPLDEFAGREISLIIANEGTEAGLLGIGTIAVSEYIGQIYDKTPLFSSKEGERELSFKVGLFAPCKGFTAKLSTSTGIEEDLSCKENLSEKYEEYELSFKSSFALVMGQVMEYQLTVLPNLEEATPLVLQGSTGCAEGYPYVCVEEEGTGEKCGYCPAGAAGLEKFTDEYEGRFIGIGIHCTEVFSTGVMESPSYANPFVYNSEFPIDGLPAAVLNRREIATPTDFNTINERVASLLEETSVAETRIQSIYYEPESHNLKVKFKTNLALPLLHTDFRAAAVLLADSLTGNDGKWWQTNYYSNTSKDAFLKTADESWWEYMKFYCEYPAKMISPTDYTFNHVAMGIYPDFYGEGCQLKTDWADDEAEESEIEFEMPMQEEPNGFGVQNVKNTSVAVFVFDARTGEIIAADKASASSYESAAVNSIAREISVLSSYYIGLDGIQYSSSPKGFSIKVTVFSDGSVKSHKIFRD